MLGVVWWKSAGVFGSHPRPCVPFGYACAFVCADARVQLVIQLLSVSAATRHLAIFIDFRPSQSPRHEHGICTPVMTSASARRAYSCAALRWRLVSVRRVE
jgi:hypothetical protein